tara:strand:+ start:1780 stop:3342 length:1563 start_codon:yes stop_codon:yes gene_type:complete
MALLKSSAGTNTTLEIGKDWLGYGSPHLFLEPHALSMASFSEVKSTQMMETMLSYLFSAFKESGERWWLTLLDVDKVREAYEDNANGRTFKPKVYVSHLKKNLQLLENATLLELIDAYPRDKGNLLYSMRARVGKTEVRADFTGEEQSNKDNREAKDIVKLRQVLSQIKLKDIDNSLSTMLNLPMEDISELGEEESKKLRERQEKGKSTEEDQDIWDRTATNKKLLETLVYNIEEGMNKSKTWEAGPGYSHFNNIDIVKQYGINITEYGVGRKSGKQSFRATMDKKQNAYYYLNIELDFPKYFKQILDDGKILYTSKSTPKKSINYTLKQVLSPSLFGIDNITKWSRDHFWTEDGDFNMANVKEGKNTKSPKVPKDIDLSALLQDDSVLSEKIKLAMIPNWWFEATILVKCEIGYDKKVQRVDKKSGKTVMVSGNPTETKFIAEKLTITKLNKIKPQLYGYVQSKGKNPTMERGDASFARTHHKGKANKQSEWTSAGNDKLAAVLHPIRRTYHRLKELIL